MQRPQPVSAAYRLNARLDAASHAKLTELEQKLKASTSDIVRQALDEMYATQIGSAKNSRGLDDLVGKYTHGPRDLARNAKSYQTESLTKKHGGQ